MTGWVAFAALVVQTVVWLVGGTWLVGRALNKLESGFTAALTAGRVEIDHSIALIENDLRDQIASSAREHRQTIESVARLIGNDIAVLREKLHEHELSVGLNYVRRESFYKVADEIKALVTDRIDKIETKIDRIQERNRSRDG